MKHSGQTETKLVPVFAAFALPVTPGNTVLCSNNTITHPPEACGAVCFASGIPLTQEHRTGMQSGAHDAALSSKAAKAVDDLNDASSMIKRTRPLGLGISVCDDRALDADTLPQHHSSRHPPALQAEALSQSLSGIVEFEIRERHQWVRFDRANFTPDRPASRPRQQFVPSDFAPMLLKEELRMASESVLYRI
ncbi:hypothetical protein JOL62DRAFT_642868 [Phyllosticta paracitricarpa]|uniref:Uncharacterized protein n=1 Tax=Phyllosticta paracitricarpa TaxID=2016321 RepID=A0ABR1MSC0_9PEZI